MISLINIRICSLYPLVQLSTTSREWVSLLLLHYCVYEPSDPRSLCWSRPSLPDEIIASNAPQTSRAVRTSSPSLGFIEQFQSSTRLNPCVSLQNRTVNEDFLQDIYPVEFAGFRLPLNPLLKEIVQMRPGLYRCVYAGEDPSFLHDMNTNPNSIYVNGTSPRSPLAGQTPCPVALQLSYPIYVTLIIEASYLPWRLHYTTHDLSQSPISLSSRDLQGQVKHEPC